MEVNRIQSLNLKGKRILIVEDDYMNAHMLRGLFTGTFAEIVHVLTASAAIELVQNNSKIDVILLDIQLPDMNGLQAAKSIKNKRPDLPIVVQTAYPFDSYKQKSKEVGCEFFLNKPIETVQLYDVLKKVFFKNSKTH
jgi:two-component system, cell cycle response regulator DivK